MSAHAISVSQRPLFRRRLLAWYEGNGRRLPWRATRDPYRIWVSEIMLQQTRVAAVREPYSRFLRRFPDVRTLARARLASVLAEWSGLGYYRRARHLHEAARLIVRQHGGRFPQSAADLRRLPGIGRYTAAAIASIAFSEPAAVLDGNVERVLRRLSGRALSPSQLWDAAAGLLSPRRPGDFNQAMMELGATVCLPGEPLCGACPVARWCATRGRGATARPAPRRRARLDYALVAGPRGILLVRRPAHAALMPGMWELPPAAAGGAAPALRLRHAITTTDYEVSVFRQARPAAPPGAVWVPRRRLPRLALTGLARKALRAAGLLV